MKKQTLGIVLIFALLLGLAAPALAYESSDFTDVPADHWAYAAVMEMADAGYIKGTGDGKFSPAETLTAEMFVVLVGRVAFPDVTAESVDWSGPYVAAAEAAGLLVDTKITMDTLKDEVSRYDMAVVLTECAPLLGITTTKADSAQVSDFGDIPNRYTDAVLFVYGTGLIQGDEAGHFNGSKSMTRQEAAIVLSRLIALSDAQAKANQAEAERKAAETQAAYDASRTGEYVTVHIKGDVGRLDPDLSELHLGLYLDDGRLLADAVVPLVFDEYGDADWEMDVTLDKGDYFPGEKRYHVLAMERATNKYGNALIPAPLPTREDQFYKLSEKFFVFFD